MIIMEGPHTYMRKEIRTRGQQRFSTIPIRSFGYGGEFPKFLEKKYIVMFSVFQFKFN